MSSRFFAIIASVVFSSAALVAQPALPTSAQKPAKIVLSQINPTVGDFKGNMRQIIEGYQRAVVAGATMVLTPELILPGYPPDDLISDRPEMLQSSLEAIQTLKDYTRGKDVPLVIGHLDKNPKRRGRKLQNAVSILVDGEAVFHTTKRLLPTYNVFDEMRYYEPGKESFVWEWKGIKYGVLICEDFWFNDDHDGRLIYPKNPVDDLIKQGAERLISISASPGTKGKFAYRVKIHSDVARRAHAPLIWINQVGATDDLVFDGNSFVVDANGEFVGKLASHETDFGVVTMSGPLKDQISIQGDVVQPDFQSDEDEEMEFILQTILVGTRDFVRKTGNKKLVLGLSGGMDSSLVAVLAALAIGSENVTAISMPSKYSPEDSKSDAQILAERMRINFYTVPIHTVVEALTGLTEAGFEDFSVDPRDARVAEENRQARIRKVIEYDFSRRHPGTLVLTTGCKSELAQGWCTKYGDHAGDFAPIGDLWKTEEYKLARYINRKYRHLFGGDLIHEAILKKAPSPDLLPGQKTSDVLPPYQYLDPVLSDYLEKGMSIAALTVIHGPGLLKVEPHRPTTWVHEAINRLHAAQNKIDVSATAPKINRRPLNKKKRRIPIARFPEGRDERFGAGKGLISCTDDLSVVAEELKASNTARP